MQRNYKENQPLANWVHYQRAYKHSKLSEEHINMLNDIGFDWTVQTRDSIAWNDKFEELKQYKTKKGDCKVPSIYIENQPLANWVSWQRHRYRISRLSEEHINMLNDIGFDWTVPPKASTTAQTEINTEQEDHEKVETPCTRTLQGRIQVLCKLSLMFRKQKDVIYANMKKRKLDNSALGS